MRTLVIETATSACSVALFDEAILVAHDHRLVGRGHAEQLMPMIAALPDGGRCDAILVDCGPGSFTGVRVGLAAARALGFAWRVPVTGYSSMALIAATHQGTEPVGVAIIGGHGELFVQRFASAPLVPLSALASLVPEEAAASLPEPLVIGSAAVQIVALRGSGTALNAQPDARLALRLPPELRALAPSPIYGRAPDAKPMASAP